MVLTGCIALGALAGVAGAADGLVDSSPFMPVGTPEQTIVTPGDGSSLELRGVIMTSAGPKFSIYDPAKRTSSWVGLEEKGRPFLVRSYDAARDTVSVDFQGQTVTLGLKSAKIAAAPLENYAAAGPRQPLNEPAEINPTEGDEQRRLEAIAAEVNRRRALRQKALQEQRRIREEARRPGNAER